MSKPARPQLITIAVLICAALLLAACTRSATTQTLPTVPPEGVGGGGEGIGGGDAAATESAAATSAAAMEALLVAGQTQTAQALLLATPTNTPVPTSPPPPTATPTSAGPASYTVQPGDWLYQIARKYNVDPKALIAANPHVNPNAILRPGTVLTIPASTSPVPGSSTTGRATYVVKAGDNLFRIALNNNTTYTQLALLNGIPAPYIVYPGQVLILP